MRAFIVVYLLLMIGAIILWGCIGSSAPGAAGALAGAKGALKPPPTPVGDFAIVQWVAGLSLILGVAGIIASAVPYTAPFVSKQAAWTALVTAIALLVLNYILVKYLKIIVWGSFIIAALAVAAHGPVWWKGFRRWWTDEPLPLTGARKDS